MFQVYSWGDNEHGQLGNNSTICNRKPQIIPSLKGQRICKIACGSSHNIAFAQGTLTTAVKFSPISFSNSKDILGASVLHGKSSDDAKETKDKERPTLTQIIISLKQHSKRQEALGHVLTALQIAYARDTIVNALGGIVYASAHEKKQGTGLSSVELTAGLPISSIVPKKAGGDEKEETSLLDEYTTLLTVEDARVLVDLLKLAVAGRVGEKGKETLSVILNTMGKANQDVSQLRCMV